MRAVNNFKNEIFILINQITKNVRTTSYIHTRGQNTVLVKTVGTQEQLQILIRFKL